MISGLVCFFVDLFFCHLEPLFGCVACGLLKEISKALVGVQDDLIACACVRLCYDLKLLALDTDADALEGSVGDMQLSIGLIYLAWEFFGKNSSNALYVGLEASLE